MLKVFGHLSPDTDAVCSAIVWAWYYQEKCGQAAAPFILGELNSETTFVLEYFKVATPQLLSTVTAADQVVIVDTNNPQELPAGIEEAQIINIIDHHKLVGGLTSDGPISITMRPVACTATILYDLMHLPAADLPPHISGLLLAAILSDTLGFRSPTTTDTDRRVASELATALEITINDFVEQLFQAKSDLTGFTNQELVTLDSKKYPVGEYNVRVSVLETTSPQTVFDRSEGIVSAIKNCIENESDVDEVLFFIVDILHEEATVLTYNELTTQIIQASFSVTPHNGQAKLPGIISRKKQIVPVLTT